MKLLEYRAKELFKKYDIPVPREIVALDKDQAVENGEKLGYPVVIKAQVGVGGRGKAGGIKIANNRAELEKVSEDILSMSIKDEKVSKVLISEAVNIDEELYLDTLVKSIKMLPSNVSVSRVTAGISDKSLLSPMWCNNKHRQMYNIKKILLNEGLVY